MMATVDMKGHRAITAQNAYRRALAIPAGKLVYQLEAWSDQSQALRSGMEEKHYVVREVYPITDRNNIMLDPVESPCNFLEAARKSSALIADGKGCVAVRVKENQILVLFNRGCKVGDLRALGKDIGTVLFAKAELPHAAPLEGWAEWNRSRREAHAAQQEGRVLVTA